MAAIPSRIGNYEVLRQIGTGGMGSVYLGRDPELDRQVAIKVIREEVQFRIAAEVHGAHPSGANLAEDLVVADSRRNSCH